MVAARLIALHALAALREGADLFDLLTDISVPNMRKAEKKKSRGGKGSEGLIVPNDPASISYVRGILARGEAAKADTHGKLPFGKTHAIVGETADGLPILKRIHVY